MSKNKEDEEEEEEEEESRYLVYPSSLQLSAVS